MSEAAKWVGFALGVVLAIGTVIAVMKTLIVPRRSWSFLAATIGRLGYRVFYGIAARLRRACPQDARCCGFEACGAGLTSALHWPRAFHRVYTRLNVHFNAQLF